MDLYSIVLFAHIVGAVLLFVLLTVEGVGHISGIAYAPVSRILGPISALAILAPGLYLMKMQWGGTAWVVVGIVTWVLIAVGGAITGVGVMRGTLSSRVALISWTARLGMALAVVFDMTVKPNAGVSIVTVAAGMAIG